MSSNQISPALIMAQVSHMLSADTFLQSGTLSRFLKFIVEETLAGRESELKEYTIAVKVLSKRPDFNPQNDPIVRIHAGRLRRLLSEYYHEAGKHDAVVISIPKGAYVPVFSQQAGMKGPSVEKEAAPVIRKRVTIAVLPFNNISTDTSAIGFADGLADHISTALTRYSELSVISYYSCRNIIGKIHDIREAGLALDANYVLTGTVQKQEQRLRIMVQLTRTESREQVWANAYERNCTGADLFEVQDEIVWQVVSQTAGHYGAISRNIARITPRGNITDAGVYDAMFWYYNFVGNLTEDFFHTASSAMHRAITIDPDYAMGWAVLGEILVGGYFMGYTSTLVEHQLEQGVAYARTAIRIDPYCQHGYQTLALAGIFLQNKALSLNAIEEWSRIKPAEAGIMGAMGFVLICCGEYDAGFSMLEESIQLNPYYQWWFNAGIAFYHYKKAAYENVLYWAEKMNTPGVAWELILKIAATAKLNDTTTARALSVQLVQWFPQVVQHANAYISAFLQDPLLVQDLLQTILPLLAHDDVQPGVETTGTTT